MMKKIIIILFLCLCSFLRGQDVNWSQPANTLLYQNPAFTGLENKYSFNLNYRNQWNVANNAYRDYMVSGDCRFDKSNNIWLGLGGVILKDEQGFKNYKTTSATLNLSCIVRLNARTRLSAGFAGSFVQNTLDMGNYSWGTQYNGEKYDPNLSSGESSTSFSRGHGDMNAGIALSYDNAENLFLGENNKRWLLGYSISHLTSPNISMTGGKDRLQVKHTAYIKSFLSLNDKYALAPVVYGYYQANMKQVTFGSLFRVSTGDASKITNERKASSFSFGLLYRVNDALIPTVEAESGKVVFALCYDITASKFTKADRLRGGIELSLRIRALGTSDRYATTIHTGKKAKGTQSSTVKRRKRFSFF